MKRLTRKAPGGYALIEGKELGTVKNNREVVNRLAAYENCGLEPDEVMRLVLFVQEAQKVLEARKEEQNGDSQHR